MKHPEIKYGKEQKNLAAWEHIEEIYRALRRRWSTNFTNVLYNLNRLASLRTLPQAAERYSNSLSPLFENGAGVVRNKTSFNSYNTTRIVYHLWVLM